MTQIDISFDELSAVGCLTCSIDDAETPIWTRIKGRVIASGDLISTTNTCIILPWLNLLELLREYGTRRFQDEFDFRFVPHGAACDRIQEFLTEYRRAEQLRTTPLTPIDAPSIEELLRSKGFTKRKLRSFQLRDLAHLSALPHGANFSVPGAGKTSVTLALHLVTRRANSHILVVGPKAAFPAWREVTLECMDDVAPENGAEQFSVLSGSESEIDTQLSSGRTRFVISYDLLIRNELLFSQYLARTPVHLVLDEAHRIKAGESSQRGALLLKLASRPFRRDILTGTPMPQGADDLASQLAFLWPGSPYRVQIQRGTAPRVVLGNLYVRTTKSELGLVPARRTFYQVEMSSAQVALYGIVRNEALRQFSRTVAIAKDSIDFIGAKRSVMRLLQLSSNPALAIRGMMADPASAPPTGIIDQIISEGASVKIRAVMKHARELAQRGEKTVIWTIFTENIRELERGLVDLNPVSLYGEIPSGLSSDINTREGRLRRFHIDPECHVLIANPAAAGEGISLHTVCHNAIYLDRSYVSTHYLQSIDRIHRLGLAPGIETFIHIYESKTPAGIGSIDYSVRRRLVSKIRGLEQLLDDSDLRQIAYDEENAADPVDFDLDIEDLIDLVAELEGRSALAEDEP